MRITEELKEGFQLIRQSEKLLGGDKTNSLRLSSLIHIANHEQLKILQPLIYENSSFQATLKAQAFFEGVPFIPVRVAAFSTACDVKQEKIRVQMKHGDLYDAQDRMQFIRAVAQQYHSLMSTEQVYMDHEIRKISTWADS